MSSELQVSVIFELDNATFEDFPVWSSRLLDLMHWVCLSVPLEAVEFIVVYSAPSGIDSLLQALPEDLAARVSTLDLAGLPANYYQMKNAGAQIAKGEFLVFLDSDLVAVDGSLNDLLKPVVQKKCIASCGYTFFPTESFLERCYAIFWMFPIYKFPETLGVRQLLVSNTVVHREWFIENGSFLQIGGFKVSCALLARAIERDGHSIAHPDVWFRHALWNSSLRFFIWRALVTGRDADKKQAHGTHGERWLRAKGALRNYRMDIGRLYKRHLRYGHQVGLGSLGILPSFLIGTFFYTLVRGAQLFAALRPVNTAFELVPDKYIT